MTKESESHKCFPFINERFLLLQPCIAGETPSYLVYRAPEGETEGHFVQEEGGMVWFSNKYPEGETCRTELISKDQGDHIINSIKEKLKLQGQNPSEKRK